MGILDYFKPVSTWPAERVRALLVQEDHGEYTLVDVRQPKEYERGHLPGALLLPMGELPDRLGELDPNKTVITYCAAGVRSRAAAALLSSSGFKDAHSLEGGMRSWAGLVAEGTPEAGMSFFSLGHTPEELISLAWLLEDGSRRFYGTMSKQLDDRDARTLFQELATAEEHHKSALYDLHRHVSGRESNREFPAGILAAEPADDDVMEGGIKVTEALKWAAGKSVGDILELSLSLETNSYDLYLKMERLMTDRQSKEVFTHLSKEEAAHLKRLAALLDNRV